MDLSPNFIKMCEKAVEIQKQWVDIYDDSIACNVVKETDYKPGFFPHPSWRLLDEGRYFFIESPCIGCDSEYGVDEDYYQKRTYIWLPRQDQLQEMVEHSLYRTLNDFCDFVNDGLGWELMKYKLTIDYFTSMEQLWLAFAMKEKYNKTWNGEDWVGQ